MPFAENVSVVIGKNGSGKTSLIRAIVYSLYFIFTNDRSMGDDFISSGNPDLKMHSLKSDEFFRSNSNDTVASDANFHGSMTFHGEEIMWDMYRRSTPGSALYPSRYNTAYKQFVSICRKYGNYPIVAYFSDSFPHTLTNISAFARTQMSSNGSTLRNFGYYQWDNETACVEIWQRRLMNSMIKLQQLGNETDEFTKNEVFYVVERLKRFSNVVHADVCDDDFEIDKLFFLFDEDQKPELWARLKSGTEIRFNKLPAGYKRLYSIVLDLAYRSYLLNRDITIEPYGLALIDEVDLHLHPSLEMEVVERFTRTFPQLQFIMTTHSPLVVGNLNGGDDKNKIFRMVAGEEAPHQLPDLYGFDYDDVLVDWMEGASRNKDLEFLEFSYKRAFDMKNQQLMDMRRAELEALVGNNKAWHYIEKWQK